MSFTPGPWEAVEATEHHGWYVTSDFGNTICDLYCMSRPDLPSTINGGLSHPVPFMHEMDGPNARLIALAPTMAEALIVVRDALRKGSMTTAMFVLDSIIAKIPASDASGPASPNPSQQHVEAVAAGVEGKN